MKHKYLFDALLELVCCPAFTGELFERDKESHKAWTIAGWALDKYRNETKDDEGKEKIS